ncbi:MAG: ROK family transcriptional regulator [Devosia sp.]
MDELVAPTRVLRQLSVQAVMDVLLREGSASRAGLSRTTKLSKQTMSEVIRLLTERGWVRESGMISGGIGRSAVRYEVDAEAGFALGVDLGSSTIRASVANISGAIVKDIEIASDPRGGAHLVAQIGALKATVLEEASIPRERLLQATVAIPGVMDPVTGRLSLAPNLDDMMGLDVAFALRQVLDCKVTFENDVNAGAIGEYWETRQSHDGYFAFISIGTGVGLGILVDGKLLRGAFQAAGEVGYLPLGSDPFMPLSVERGALERVLGAPGIAARYHSAGGEPSTSVRVIFDRYNRGERAAIVTIEETARLGALLVATVTAVIDPSKVVLGGNIGGRPELVDLIRQILPAVTRRPVLVEGGLLGPRATVVGAAAIALGEQHNSLFSPRELPNKRDVPTGRR